MTTNLKEELASLKIDREAPPRDRGKALRWLVYLLIAGGLAAAVYFLVLPRITGSFFRTEVKTAEILLISPAQSSVQLTSSGYVVAEVNAKVAAKTQGRIAELLVHTNDQVTAGQAIARLADGRSATSPRQPAA